MYYNKRNGFYRHYECSSINGRNARNIQKNISDSAPKRFVHPVIGKCKYCKTFDNKDNFYQSNKCSHKTCQQIQLRNSAKMKKHKTDTCAFTGLPFGDKSEMKPVGDHDHDTLLYRGHIWSAANRLEGAIKFIMQETGCSLWDVFDMADKYLAKPGKDIGLEPYPQLGFATAEEAIEHYETTN
jgi:hypothetical protein